MRWYRVLSVAALAGRLAAFDLSAGDESAPARLTGPAVAVARAPVLRREEPRDSVMVRLPGPAAKPAPVLRPFTPPPLSKAEVAPPVPTLPEPEVKPAPVLRPFIPPAAPNVELAPPLSTVLEPPLTWKLPLPTSKLEVSALLPPRPALPASRTAPKGLPKPILPPDFERDSALFCQRRISQWMQPDAYNIFGEALRDRPAYNDDRTENGRIYAYADPSGRYRELELDFAADTGILRSVFVYPWKMTWQDCRRLWGANVASADASKGRTFYSYLNRRLDVLVDAGGRVISLGLY